MATQESQKASWVRGLTLLVTLLVTFACCGCATATRNDYEAFLNPPGAQGGQNDYVLEPPDEITITSKLVRELNGHVESIRPDGKITLPLVGSVPVAGLTCEKASTVIQHQAKEFYEGADVSLRVSGFRSKRIYVFGEVASPGRYPYTGSNTVLGTLATAQPTRLADPSRVQILRPNRAQRTVSRMTVNLDRMIQTGDTSLDAALEDGDIVYVPANGLAAVGLSLQQLLLPIQPAAATVRGPADIEGTAVGTTYGRERAGP